MEYCFFSGRIVDLSLFNVPEFGLRASFKIERPGQASIVCAVSGEVAHKFIGRYREGDVVVVGGVREPSTINRCPQCTVEWTLSRTCRMCGIPYCIRDGADR